MRILALCLSLFFMSSYAACQATIEIAGGTMFHLGSVYRGDVANHDLTIRNGGQDTLVIHRVDVSCGCTGSMLSADRIAPGDSGTLHVTFNSGNFRGPVHKTLTINSNAANSPQLMVQFDGSVVEEVTVAPEYLWFQDAVQDKRSSQTLTIKNNSTAPIRLTGFSTALEGLMTVLPGAPIKPGESVEIPIEYTPVKALPVFSDRLVIRTSHARQKEITVGLYGSVRPPK